MTAPTDAMLEALAGQVAAQLMALGHGLVTAESCTGGWIGKVCTDLPGSSRWFLGGAIVYGNGAKSELLGVDSSILAAHGAVSEPAARAMASGALQRVAGDVSVAVTGIAGPDGGTPDKPVGMVWFAWGRRIEGQVVVESAVEYFRGDREAVRRQTVERALRGLLGS